MGSDAEERISKLEARLQGLEAQVGKLNDLEAIRTLRRHYHECINEGRNAEIINLFAADPEIDFAHLGRGKGKAQVNAFFSGISIPAPGGGQPQLYSFVKQFIHNMVVNVHGDTADGFSYLEAKPIYNDESFLVAGRYDDEYVRENGQWKFKSMKLTAHFMVPLKEGWAQADRIKMGIRA